LTAILEASKANLSMDDIAEPTAWESLASLPDAVRLPLTFDPAALQDDLARLEATAWTRHFIPENYQGDWSVLPLRAPATARHPIQQIYSDPGCRDWVDTPWLLASPAITAALARFDCTVTSVRLMRLTAGCRSFRRLRYGPHSCSGDHQPTGRFPARRQPHNHGSRGMLVSEPLAPAPSKQSRHGRPGAPGDRHSGEQLAGRRTIGCR
jgi:hypothetical protein